MTRPLLSRYRQSRRCDRSSVFLLLSEDRLKGTPRKINIIFLRGTFYFSTPLHRHLTRAEVFLRLAGSSFGKDDCDEQPGGQSRGLERFNIVLTSIRYDPAESAYRAVRPVNRINSISCQLFPELIRSPLYSVVYLGHRC